MINIYKVLKLIISRGGYDKNDILTKIDVYYTFDKLTKEQYEELTTEVRGNSNT